MFSVRLHRLLPADQEIYISVFGFLLVSTPTTVFVVFVMLCFYFKFLFFSLMPHSDGCLHMSPDVTAEFVFLTSRSNQNLCVCFRSVEHCFHMCDRVVIYFFIAASYTPW